MADALFGVPFVNEFNRISRRQSAQLKFEVEDRLSRYYLRPGKPLKWIFKVIHEREIEKKYPELCDDMYPTLCGYALLVSRNEISLRSEQKPENISNYLERVIEGAVEAEFFSYFSLPEIKTEELIKWFSPAGPAYIEIVNLLVSHKKKNWIISNKYNPSTKRLIRVKIKEIGSKDALATTTEYWYLRWWHVDKSGYVYSYRETNFQKYVLGFDGELWRIEQNLRPSPRSTTPNRRVK